MSSKILETLCLVVSSVPPLTAGPLKIWGISSCLTLINVPHLYQLKRRKGCQGECTQIESRWLWNSKLWSEAKEKGSKGTGLRQHHAVKDQKRMKEKHSLTYFIKYSGQIWNVRLWFVTFLIQTYRLVLKILMLVNPKIITHICLQLFLLCWIIKHHWSEQQVNLCRHAASFLSVVKQYGKTWHGCVWKLAAWM